jgi:putative endonuclease
MNNYHVYILLCADGTYYTGITTDIIRRVQEHNGSRKGAKYTCLRRPVRMAYLEESSDRSTAMKRERSIKRLSRRRKELLVQTWPGVENKPSHGHSPNPPPA